MDYDVRLAAFDWLREKAVIYEDVFPRELLEKGFDHRGDRIPLVGPSGIFKPKVMDLPLSFTTIPDGPYDDGISNDNIIYYRYRGDDPRHPDNAGLRECMLKGYPLIYFYRQFKGKYTANFPAFIVGDDPGSLTFRAQIDSPNILFNDITQVNESDQARREYVTATVKIRLHQRSFRERVIAAYRSQCSFCRLRHEQLLDAAHIIPDNEPDSRPTVNNGLSLCKIHHAAFDKFFLGVTPDYIIQVRQDVLDEIDGPMLQHGLKELHNQKIILPRHDLDKPDRNYLAWRFERFGRVV